MVNVCVIGMGMCVVGGTRRVGAGRRGMWAPGRPAAREPPLPHGNGLQLWGTISHHMRLHPPHNRQLTQRAGCSICHEKAESGSRASSARDRRGGAQPSRGRRGGAPGERLRRLAGRLVTAAAFCMLLCRPVLPLGGPLLAGLGFVVTSHGCRLRNTASMSCRSVPVLFQRDVMWRRLLGSER